MTRKGTRLIPALLPMLILAAAGEPAWAAWTYPGCADVTNADFRRVRVVQRGGAADPGLDEPMKLAFDAVPDPAGGVLADIYFVERKGKVKHYDARRKSARLLGQVDTYAGEDQGLNGIALDPGFKQNRFLYLYYSPKSQQAFRLSRFTLADTGLDMGSEKALLDIPSAERRDGVWHSSGAMAFDAYGDLWVTVGKNSLDDPQTLSETLKHGSSEWGSACTANLRGGVLRIHPDASSPKGYTIPKGNFGEHFAEKYRQAGNLALAGQYADPKKVLPEIFVKGTRNAYTVSVDPVRRWLTWGCVGPNRREKHEEFNLARTPGFFGFPYFAGDNLSLVGNKDPLKPLNTSRWCAELGGAQELPPAIPAIYPYIESAAMTGPIYRYDPALKSAIKLPPHFHRLWIVGDWNGNGWFKTLALDSAGARVLGEQPLFTGLGRLTPLDIEQGPDGAIYVTNYAGYFNSSAETSIDRIEYTGPPCQAQASLVVEKAGCRDPRFAEFDPAATHPWPEACRTPTRAAGPGPLPRGMALSLAGGRLRTSFPGPYALSVATLDGRILTRVKARDESSIPLSSLAGTGPCILRLSTAEGSFQGTLFIP